MRLILIRHYKTEFNVSCQIMGWGDSPKVENWLEDMLVVEQALYSHGIQPDVIISSALGRSRRTAEYFADRFDVANTEVAHELNEVNYGALYQRPKKWVAEHYPLHKKDPDFVYPDGESFNQMQARAVAYIHHLARARADQTVLCVAHAGVVRALLSDFLDLDFAVQLKRKVSHRYVGVLNFNGDVCSGYDEWGNLSGFATDNAIILPYTCKTA